MRSDLLSYLTKSHQLNTDKEGIVKSSKLTIWRYPCFLSSLYIFLTDVWLSYFLIICS